MYREVSLVTVSIIRDALSPAALMEKVPSIAFSVTFERDCIDILFEAVDIILRFA